MRNLTRKALLLGVLVLTVGLVYIAFHFIFLNLLVDLWWFQSLQFESYFWLRLLYRFFLSGGVTLLFFSIFFFHFWIASRYFGLNPPPNVNLDKLDKRRLFQRFAEIFTSGSVLFYTPIPLLLAVTIAIPFYQHWESALLFLFGSSSGVTEPVYGYDISFYLVSYPIYLLIQQEMLTAAGLLFCAVGILYWLEHVYVPEQRKEFPLGAKIHLTILMGFVVLFAVWGFLLQRFSLLYIDTHQPVFFGPGFVEMRYQLPLIWLAIVTFIATAVTASLFIFSEKHRIKTPLFLSLTVFLCVLDSVVIS